MVNKFVGLSGWENLWACFLQLWLNRMVWLTKEKLTKKNELLVFFRRYNLKVYNYIFDIDVIQSRCNDWNILIGMSAVGFGIFFFFVAVKVIWKKGALLFAFEQLDFAPFIASGEGKMTEWNFGQQFTQYSISLKSYLNLSTLLCAHARTPTCTAQTHIHTSIHNIKLDRFHFISLPRFRRMDEKIWACKMRYSWTFYAKLLKRFVLISLHILWPVLIFSSQIF